jgi:hypothetical protein
MVSGANGDANLSLFAPFLSSAEVLLNQVFLEPTVFARWSTTVEHSKLLVNASERAIRELIADGIGNDRMGGAAAPTGRLLLAAFR